MNNWNFTPKSLNLNNSVESRVSENQNEYFSPNRFVNNNLQSVQSTQNSISSGNSQMLFSKFFGTDGIDYERNISTNYELLGEQLSQIYFCSITSWPQFSDKSAEELRYQDFLIKKARLNDGIVDDNNNYLLNNLKINKLSHEYVANKDLVIGSSNNQNNINCQNCYINNVSNTVPSHEFGTIGITYNPTILQEYNEVTKTMYININSITVMPECFNKSAEELRYEDFKCKSRIKK